MRGNSEITMFLSQKSMVNIEQYKTLGKNIIKNRFHQDIEIDIVPFNEFETKKQELSEKYDIEINNEIKRGLFVPFDKKSYSYILIGYEDEYDLNTIFFHELQHAIDYHEFHALHGKEGFDKIGYNFTIATEFRAVYFEKLNLFRLMSPQDLGKYIIGGKMHFKGKLKECKNILEVISYLAIISAYAKVEGNLDISMLQRSPGVDYFVGLLEHLLEYKPTIEWFDVLNSKILQIND